MRTLTKTLLFLCLLFALVAAASAQSAASVQSAQDFLNRTPFGNGTPDGVPPSGETVCAGQVGAAHGLCTAYCEAMDCDSANPQASPTACSKVRANYIKHTGQAPPCDCPCVNQYPGFADAVNGPILACFEHASPDFSFDDVILTTPDPTFAPSTVDTPFGAACGNRLSFPFPITADQGRACINLLKQRAAASGVPCTPTP